MVTLLKLGGSLITDKEEPETVDGDALEGAVSAIERFLDAPDDSGRDGLVLVHGGGSFGHHHASTHDVSETRPTTDASAVADIHRAMTELNASVVSRLHEASVEAVPVRPLSLAYRGDSGLYLPPQPLQAMLGEGFVPVLHGDVIVDAGKGATILSGDEIIVSLARTLDASAVGLCSTVPGVLDEDGHVIPEIESYAAVETHLGESAATDVTGGMAGKVTALLELETPASVFGPDELEKFLRTGAAGTTIR